VPVHVTSYDAVAEGVTVFVPDKAPPVENPVPELDVELVHAHVNVELPPAVIDPGLALNEADGGDEPLERCRDAAMASVPLSMPTREIKSEGSVRLTNDFMRSLVICDRYGMMSDR
jgi:hypothetical protein